METIDEIEKSLNKQRRFIMAVLVAFIGICAGAIIAPFIYSNEALIYFGGIKMINMDRVLAPEELDDVFKAALFVRCGNEYTNGRDGVFKVSFPVKKDMTLKEAIECIQGVSERQGGLIQSQIQNVRAKRLEAKLRQSIGEEKTK